jgi:hypothetical protein
MADNSFGFASHTFTVQRKGGYVTDPDNPQNQIPSPTLSNVATGVAITLMAVQEIQLKEEFGVATFGKFLGMAESGVDIRVADVLKDEGNNNPDGSPVRYEVTGAFDRGADLGLPSLKLYLSLKN